MSGFAKKIGNKINSIIKRNKFLNFIDTAIENTTYKLIDHYEQYSDRSLRRYSSFIGNRLITKDKVNLIKKSLPINLQSNLKIFDLGCADGSLLFELYSLNNNLELYGADSGYKKCFVNKKMPNNINIVDLNLYHPHYNPNGINDPDIINLQLPQNLNLVIMYDVFPYLTSKTIDNYFNQIADSLTTDGLIFLTCKIETTGKSLIEGAMGEKYQDTIYLSQILDITKNRFEIINLAWGDWDKTREHKTIYGADIIVLQKSN